MTLNLEKAIEKLRNKELLLELEIMEICGLAREMLLEDPNVVRVISPVTVIKYFKDYWRYSWLIRGFITNFPNIWKYS